MFTPQGYFILRLQPCSKLTPNSSYSAFATVNLKPNSLLTPNYMTKNVPSGPSLLVVINLIKLRGQVLNPFQGPATGRLLNSPRGTGPSLGRKKYY